MPPTSTLNPIDPKRRALSPLGRGTICRPQGQRFAYIARDAEWRGAAMEMGHGASDGGDEIDENTYFFYYRRSADFISARKYSGARGVVWLFLVFASEFNLFQG